MEKLIDKDLKEYIEKNILEEYKLNDKGHGIEHINFVLKRALELSENYEIDYNKLYAVVCFHDIACHINREEHEKLSAKKLFDDKYLRTFFKEEEMKMMKEAVEDHRASLEYIPRNIYGKILSSADRKIGVDEYLKTSIGFELKKNNNKSKKEVIEESYAFAIKKFGKKGYAITKMFVKDKKYEDYLNEIQYLIDHKEDFISRANEVYEKLIKEL